MNMLYYVYLYHNSWITNPRVQLINKQTPPGRQHTIDRELKEIAKKLGKNWNLGSQVCEKTQMNKVKDTTKMWQFPHLRKILERPRVWLLIIGPSHLPLSTPDVLKVDEITGRLYVSFFSTSAANVLFLGQQWQGH